MLSRRPAKTQIQSDAWCPKNGDRHCCPTNILKSVQGSSRAKKKIRRPESSNKPHTPETFRSNCLGIDDESVLTGVNSREPIVSGRVIPRCLCSGGIPSRPASRRSTIVPSASPCAGRPACVSMHTRDRVETLPRVIGTLCFSRKPRAVAPL